MFYDHSRRILLGAAILALAACSGSVEVGPGAIAGLTPDGTIDMHELQVAYMGSATGGNGMLFYHGQGYPFSVTGLGVGGIGASSIDAQGEVYKLPNLAQFPGRYAEARYGFALGSRSAGDLWLENGAGVILHLNAKRTGLMLSLGGDAVIDRTTVRCDPSAPGRRSRILLHRSSGERSDRCAHSLRLHSCRRAASGWAPVDHSRTSSRQRVKGCHQARDGPDCNDYGPGARLADRVRERLIPNATRRAAEACGFSGGARSIAATLRP